MLVALDNHDAPVAWPDTPSADPRPGLQNLADDELADGWTDQLLFWLVTGLIPVARAALRRITKPRSARPSQEEARARGG
ncbi:hypothetical protein [Streptomyces sp. NPDC001880]